MQELNKRALDCSMILSCLNCAGKGFYFNYISCYSKPTAQALPRQPSVTDANMDWGPGKGSWITAGISDLVKFEGLPKCQNISGTSTAWCLFL